MKLKLILITVIALFSLTVNAQDTNLYERSNYISGADTLPYRILFPKNFDPSKKYPLILVLHGAGERGNDNEAQLIHGSKLFTAEENRDKFPAIVIFPQCPKGTSWANMKIDRDSAGNRTVGFQKKAKPTKAMQGLLGLTHRMLDKPYVDKKQVYAGGLSMGAMGTFELLRREPKTFAAAFAICGGDSPKNVKKYKKVPIWVFHGDQDDTVPLAWSQVVVDALKEKGADVKFTVYPGVKHNSWNNAFAEPEFLPWLLSYKK